MILNVQLRAQHVCVSVCLGNDHFFIIINACIWALQVKFKVSLYIQENTSC